MDLHELPDQPFERHPWEVARARFFAAVLARHGLREAKRRVLDVGAGDGYLAHELSKDLPAGSEVVCFDPHYSDAQVAGLGRAAGVSFTRQPPEGSFDVI